MRVLVLGVGKSGTTALLHKLAASIPDCRTYAGGRPGKHRTQHPNAVFKHTLNEKKGRSGEVFRRHLESAHYDKKIWIARDPRDRAVSALLYRWYAGLNKDRRQYLECLALVQEKEREPRCLPFHRLYCFSGEGARPDTLEQMVTSETAFQRRLERFVRGLGNDWFLFRYEDMVEQRFDALNAYLGRQVQGEAEVPPSEQRIVRRKSHGDWRHWFTEEDCSVFRPIFAPYMDLVGYDSSDWSLSPEPYLDPRFGSQYMQKLARRDPRDSMRRLRKRISSFAGRRIASMLGSGG